MKTFLNILIPKMRFYSKVIMPPDPDDWSDPLTGC